MAIRMVPDLGAPVTVVAVDLITESYAPGYNEWAAYILAAGGYLAAGFNWGGDFMKNVGIASFPWAAKKIYDRARGGVPVARRATAFKRVARYPAPALETPFGGVRLV